MDQGSLPVDRLVDVVVSNAGRATLPFQEAHTDRYPGTAFWYNDLVDATAGAERIRQVLVTASGVVGYELGQWTLRSEVCEPEMSAELLLMPGFEGKWIGLPELGVAVMPTGGLHRYSARKGWQWSTDEVTEGVGATSADLARIADAPCPAVVLGHDVGSAGERLQAVVVGVVSRDARGVLRWDRGMPGGFAGAPVFACLPRGDGSWKLVCLGVVLPGAGGNVVAPFDRVRVAVRALSF